MDLIVNGMKPAPRARPNKSDPVAMRRQTFRHGTEIQMGLVRGENSITLSGARQPRILVDESGKLRCRKWWWQDGEEFFTDVRYGNDSMLGKDPETGEPLSYGPFPTKDDLQKFYSEFGKACDAGKLDTKLAEITGNTPPEGAIVTSIDGAPQEAGEKDVGEDRGGEEQPRTGTDG